MQLLRKKTKIIMIIVAAAFLVGFIFLQLGVGTGSRTNRQTVATNIGEINGVEISYNDFYDLQNNMAQQLKNQGKDDLSQEDYDRIEEQTWDQLVFQILIQQEIKRRGITVSDEEVRDYLLNNPPDFIRSNENFQVDGKFSQEQYEAILNAPENRQFAANLESWVRQTLPQIKLSKQITEGIHFSDSALLQEYKEREEKVKVGYVFFDPSSLEGEDESQAKDGGEELLPRENNPYQPTLKEIRSYYDAHKKEFSDPERAVLQYIKLSVNPTSKDTTEARKKALALAERSRKGEDFSGLAKEYSDDVATADKGGDLGYIKKGEMLPALEKAAFSMKTGETSDPILTPRGWHILRVEDRRGRDNNKEVQVRHILIPIRTSLATRDSIYGIVRNILGDIRDNQSDFEAVTALQQVPVKTTNPFTKNDFLPELGPISREASSFAFSQDVGAVSQSITRMGQVFVLRISRKIPERIRPLEEVQGNIEDLLSREKKMAVLIEKASKLLSEAKEYGSLKAAAASEGDKYHEPPPFTLRDRVPGVGQDNTFIGYAHGLPVGTIGGPVRTDRGCYLIEVLERKGVDMAEFEKAKEDLRKELVNRAKSTAFERWYTSLLQEAKIEDNRLLLGYSG